VGRGGRGRRTGRGVWRLGTGLGVEAAALLAAALIGVIAVLGWLAAMLAGPGLWSHLLPFAAVVLALGTVMAVLLRAWLAARRRLAARARWLPAALALVVGVAALWVANTPGFHRDLTGLRDLIGGSAEAQRQAIAHQVYAAYRRADLAELARVLERARVYEPTVLEAAAAFGVDPEVLIGIGFAESAFYPRDSADGGRGLFPATAVAEAQRRLHVAQLDPLNQRHNAFVAAATLRLYLDQMHGDPFLGLLAYNIGPRNGGLRAIMAQFGARDFVTIQPYLQHLPRDYPIRVLSAALAYRLWRAEGRLPRYEEGDNAQRIQSVGIPGLSPARS